MVSTYRAFPLNIISIRRIYPAVSARTGIQGFYPAYSAITKPSGQETRLPFLLRIKERKKSSLKGKMRLSKQDDFFVYEKVRNINTFFTFNNQDS
jgi:hypothetical protein